MPCRVSSGRARSMRARRLLAMAVGLCLIPALAAATESAARTLSPDLLSLSRGIEAIAERVRPAVVQVLATGYSASDAATATGLLSKQRSAGSGVIVDPEGYVVTNGHVVEGARRIQVVLSEPAAGTPESRSILRPPGRILEARVVGTDRETDLAVLRIAESGLPALQFGDSDALRQGRLVLAFGSPLGLENSVSAGVVSAVARQMRPDQRMIYVQTDASINPGNSGGPLVDVEGRLVGINTFILSQSGGNEGLGFAAPSNIVRNVFEQIRRTGRVHRGEIGVHAQTLTPALAAGLGVHQDWGVLLADAFPDGAAANAGLEIGDVILRLDGKLMENARQLDVNLYRYAVGDTVSVDVLRGSRRLSLGVVVAERSDDPDRFAEMVTPEANILEGLGILALDLDERIARRLPPLRAQAGVVVAAGAGDGPSWRDPLLPGDVIYALNRQSVTSVATLRAALSRLSPLDPVVLQVERAGQLRFIALERD